MTATEAAIDAVDRALSHLGSLRTPDAIAAYLAGQHCHGLRRENCACPVARHLAAVSGRTVEIAERTWGFAGGQMDEGYVPRPVGEFIRDFDDGRYLELAETERTSA